MIIGNTYNITSEITRGNQLQNTLFRVAAPDAITAIEVMQAVFTYDSDGAIATIADTDVYRAFIQNPPQVGDSKLVVKILQRVEATERSLGIAETSPP